MEYKSAIVCFDLNGTAVGGVSQEPNPHVTLAFLGDVEALNKDVINMRLASFAASHAPIYGKFAGFAVFPKNAENENKAPVVALLDSPMLPAFRQALVKALDNCSAVDQNHGFTPHMTIAYVAHDMVPLPTTDASYAMTFPTISLWCGDEHTNFALSGEVVEKALPIKAGNRSALITARGAIFTNEVNQLAQDVFTGKISLGQWEESMKALIKGLHSSDAAIGKGGWDQMTPSDWGKVGSEVKKQYRYLHGFAEDIAANKDTISEAAIRSRSNMYGQAAEYTAMLMENGEIIAQLPWMPKDGSTECLVNCKCRWVFTVINKTKKRQLVKAVWTVDPQAESCNTCVDRYDHTVTLNLPANVDVPASIPM